MRGPKKKCRKIVAYGRSKFQGPMIKDKQIVLRSRRLAGEGDYRIVRHKIAGGAAAELPLIPPSFVLPGGVKQFRVQTKPHFLCLGGAEPNMNLAPCRDSATRPAGFRAQAALAQGKAHPRRQPMDQTPVIDIKSGRTISKKAESRTPMRRCVDLKSGSKAQT